MASGLKWPAKFTNRHLAISTRPSCAAPASKCPCRMPRISKRWRSQPSATSCVQPRIWCSRTALPRPTIHRSLFTLYWRLCVATPIIMPKLGFDMSSGKVVRWLKNEGETVHKGDAVLEIETDKATVEVQADADGVLGKILVREGDVPVGERVGEIVGAGEERGTSSH